MRKLRKPELDEEFLINHGLDKEDIEDLKTWIESEY